MTRNSQDTPAMFTHLEHIYNDQAKRNRLNQRNHKQMYYRLIANHNNQKEQLKQRDRYLNKLQNQQIDSFWNNEEQRRREIEINNRKKAYEFNQVNKSMTESIGAKKVVDPYKVNDDYNAYGAFLEHQKRRVEQEKANARLENIYQRDLKTMLDKANKQEEIQLARKKQEEMNQYYNKRNQYLSQVREKHVQDQGSYDYYDSIFKQKKMEKDMLEDYIVNKGAEDLQHRTMKRQLEDDQRMNSNRNRFISELRSQVEDDELRNYYDRKKISQSQRKVVEDRVNYMKKMEDEKKRQKSFEGKKHLEVLNGQFKPRKLLPDKEPIEEAGIGSPVHIGKYMNDDRKRQLQLIERSLQRELFINNN